MSPESVSVPSAVDAIQSNSRKFILNPPILYAWLLRPDIRANIPLDDAEGQKDFLVWWVAYGAREYHQKPVLNDSEKAIIFEPLSGEDDTNHYCRNRFSQYMLQLLAKKRPLDLSSDNAVLNAQAWFYVRFLKKFDLLHTVDTVTLGRLDDIPTFLKLTDSDSVNEPEVTWLMLFLWQLRPELQRAFDLSIRSSQLSYIAWFFCVGLQEEDLYPLVIQHWKFWLNTALELSGTTTKLPRAALMLWQIRQDLREAFDLGSPSGRSDFETWVMKAQSSEPLLKWLVQTSDAKPTDSRIKKGSKKESKSVFPAKKKPTGAKFGVNLIGCAFGEVGIGEDVRMAAAACDAADIPYSVINIPLGGVLLREADRVLEDRVTANPSQLAYPVSIICLPGFDSAIVRLHLGDAYFRGHYNIGWWPWELPVWPRNWAGAFDLIDEVWAATEFTHVMYESATTLPVSLMPPPVSVERMQPIARQNFGLPTDKFLFLYVFDFNSYLARKNPWAVVKAFHKAFPAKNKAFGLVLKTMNSKPDNPLWQDFKKQCAKDRRIILMERTLDRPEVLGLIKTCDAYVSLHRSEGFGRTMAEAMLLGKPVVGTDYSGNRDFLTNETGFPVKYQPVPVGAGDYPYVEEGEAEWAEPDIEHAARQMQKAFTAASNQPFCSRVRESVREQFSTDRIGKLMRARLEQIYRQVIFAGELSDESNNSIQ